ncbi:uncharacterized protein LOC142178218 [Nicotiana tabacum]|uniref:Uncharacterized protein LOC142178218 n=1 Tax=Nicotiana tabacum TaxID=4097 RepID=A0AC58U2G3_TOBAC
MESGPKHNCVKHPVRTGSDHIPLLLKCHNDHQEVIKYFSFLDFWTEQQEFLEVVQKAWNVQVTGNAMWRLKSKLQELGKNLSQWSTDKVGDIHQQLNSKHSREDLNKAHTKYINWLGLQENLLKHKTQTKWLQEGDYNTKCFRCVLRERRKRLQLHRIKNNRGRWVKGDDKIARTAIRHFSKLFNLPQHGINHNVLSCIPKCLTEDENAMLSELPDELEFMNVVFSLSADSTAEPYRYNGIFFQHYWEIIKKDVVDFVLEFFKGKELTRFYSHTCLVLIPKVESPTSFSELRPISLSNFTTKIISKILAERVNPLLPKPISDNQSSFFKGRLTENILLAQEIIQNITKTNIRGNMVINLDMAKAYDRISWSFLVEVFKRFGFEEFWIDMIWRVIADVWYSIIINGTRRDFSPLHRGKMSSYRGRVVLIKSILLSFSVYTLSAMSPPKGTLNLLEKHFANFFWGSKSDKTKYHWSSWKNLSTPKDEGGIGIITIKDISNTLAIKKWWRFRTQPSLWASSLEAKYCARAHPSTKVWASGDSHAWKHITLVRKQLETNIVWKINTGTCNFWLDNWTEKGTLDTMFLDSEGSRKAKVQEYITQGQWNLKKLGMILDNETVQHIANIRTEEQNEQDYAIWSPTEDGKYTNKSSWQITRSRRERNEALYRLWHKPKCDSIHHTFSEDDAVRYLWNRFGRPLGIIHQNWHVRMILKKWWEVGYSLVYMESEVYAPFYFVIFTFYIHGEQLQPLYSCGELTYTISKGTDVDLFPLLFLGL